MTLKIKIFSGEQIFFDGEADSVVAPGEKGSFGILPHHTDFISILKPGILRLTDKEKEHRFTVQSGFLEVSSSQVRVFGDMSG
ncbi:MAG: ATP synthase F1 subunit epsilon [Candidatus Aureabacteria bacterium]|nr:ATP synthase F1 subunit epsilon [Candidatus Auribacterota bacterium]